VIEPDAVPTPGAEPAQRGYAAGGRPWRPLRWIAAALAAVLVAGLLVVPRVAWPTSFRAVEPANQAPGDRSTVRVYGSAPQTFDPALPGEIGTAAVLSQLFEGLTAFAPDLSVKPALARAWQLEPGGMGLVFELRPGITYSDGTAVRAEDVVESWLHLLDPATRAPLASILDDIEGAVEYRTGQGPRGAVGLRADGDRVEVRFRRPASYFVAVAASLPLAVVPPAMRGALSAQQAPSGFIGSGAYVVEGQDATSLTLRANNRYWAGKPAIDTVRLITDLGGRSPVDVFLDGDLDYVPVSFSDAQWIRYDADLGPQLREIGSLSVDYYGFDTTRPPFDDARVRRAFARAVDWRRLATLTPGVEVATSLVPQGIPGRGSGDYLPGYDPDAARADLAAAGFPNGQGFPQVTLLTSGVDYDEAVVAELNKVLGVHVALETMPFSDYLARLDSDPPAFWSVSWIADYPAPEDFLGLLLSSGATANYGRWSNAAFDDALAAAGRSLDASEQARHYDAAQRIVQDEAPVVPVSYGETWALSRTGLLGAVDPGLGIVRFAGLAWDHDQ
jgi:ABC-type oligopeptide transport system substrate-binding subunit